MVDLKTFDQLNFIGALALHQHRRDSALGLSHVTTKTRGLLWYYNLKQRELVTRVSKVAFVHGAMQQIDQRMAQIMTEAQTAPIERKRELLKEAIDLKKQAQRIKKLG
jgi:hypothetical protein